MPTHNLHASVDLAGVPAATGETGGGTPRFPPEQPRPGALALVRRLGVLLGPLLLAAMVVPGARADHLVHLRLVLAMGLLWVLGEALQQSLGATLSSRASPFHQVVLGQVALLFYFSVRTLLSRLTSLPGVGAIELAMLVVGATAWIFLRAEPRHAHEAEEDPGRGAIWSHAAWAALAFAFIGMHSGSLGGLSSDPEAHALFAKLTAGLGAIPLTYAPYTSAPLVYPSGFATLNAVWMLLTGLNAESMVNVQVALQGCLAAGLIVEAIAGLRGRWAPWLDVGLLVALQMVFLLPIDPGAMFGEGTARQSHLALAVWPLSLVMRTARHFTRRARVLLALGVGGIGIALAGTLNITLVPSEAILCATALLAALALPAGPQPGRNPWAFLVAATLVAGVLVVSDGWAYWTVHPLPPGATPGNVGQKRMNLTRERVTAGLDALFGTREGLERVLLPRGCEGRVCPPSLAMAGPTFFPGLLLALAVWLAMLRLFGGGAPEEGPLKAALAAALIVGFGAWLEHLASAVVGTVLAAPQNATEALFHGYTVTAFERTATYLFAFVLCILMFAVLTAVASVPFQSESGRLWRSWGSAAALGVFLILSFHWHKRPVADWPIAIIPRFRSLVLTERPEAFGDVLPQDLTFFAQIDKAVPQDEWVLLPSDWQHVGNEDWAFAAGSARALPLYTRVKPAFFYGWINRAFSESAYLDRVCSAFDVPWLASMRVRWIAMTPSSRAAACMWNREYVLGRYYKPAIESDGRVLYQLRDDLIAAAAIDPLLNLPLSRPATGLPGRGATGHLDVADQSGLRGWACDRGSADSTAVQVQLTPVDGGGRTWTEVRLASQEREDAVADACDSASRRHGFWIHPRVAAGRYRAQVVALDNAGRPGLVLSASTEIEISP